MVRKDPLYWAACRLHRQLEALAARQSCTGPVFYRSVTRLGDAHAALAKAWRHIELAGRRRWHLSSRKLQDELYFQARQVLAAAHELLGTHEGPAAEVPSVPLLLAELHQLDEEFEQVRIEPRSGRIIARTKPVTLEGLHLGPFEIQLHLPRLSEQADSSCFDCVALQPHPAAGDERVTHPHVKDSALCGGEATVPISNALRQGRIADAFILVRSVLEHYNPQSPYVALEEWEGASCSDCGCCSGRDDLCGCQACEQDFCNDCISVCDLCDSSCCRCCLQRDRVSGNCCCPACRSTCSQCGRVVDDQSFIHEASLCPQCLAEQQRQSENEQEEQSNEQSTATCEAVPEGQNDA